MAQKSATIAIVKDNKVLLLKRGDTAPWMPNKYCLVGGGVDKNESLIDAVIRETKEEIDHDLIGKDILSYNISYNDKYIKTVFVCLVDDIKINLNYEHSEYKWADFNECLKLYRKKLLVPRLIRTITVLRDSGIVQC